MAVGDKLFIADKPTLDQVKVLIGSNASTASASGDVHAKLKDIRTAIFSVPSSPVKSIQRGVLSMANAVTTSTVTISPVDASKSLIFVDSGGNSANDYPVNSMVVCEFTATNALTFWREIAQGAINKIYWQVIEFN